MTFNQGLVSQIKGISKCSGTSTPEVNRRNEVNSSLLGIRLFSRLRTSLARPWADTWIVGGKRFCTVGVELARKLVQNL